MSRNSFTSGQSREHSIIGHARTPRLYVPMNLKTVPWMALLTLVGLIVIPALFANVIAPHDPFRGDLTRVLEPPIWDGGTWEYPFGTDRVGRDILTRVIYGGRVSLLIAAAGIGTGLVIGTVLGLAAGYYGGIVDAVIMRFADLSLSLPTILIALTLASLQGPSFGGLVGVLSFLLWALYARQVRAETLVIRETDYVARARVAAMPGRWIIIKHVLPNVSNTLIVLATLQIGYVIVIEATLSFLGVGVPSPTPAWGLMVAEGRDLLALAPQLSIVPGVAILLTVLGANMFGDWLRDVLDPRLRDHIGL